MYVIKRRDPEGLIYLSDAMIDCLTPDEFSETVSNFFVANMANLDEHDVLFFEKTTNEYIKNSESTPIIAEPVEKEKDVDMRKITKAVALFEKNGLQMGTDYSFHNGKIRMKKESQAKIRKLLGK